MNRDDNDKPKYWAAADSEDLGGEVEERAKRYYTHLERTGRMELLRRSYNLYHGLDSDGGWKNSAALTTGGEDGELLQLNVNEFRSLAEHTVVLVTGSRPAFTARATSADYRAQAQVQLAEGLLDYYLDELEIEEKQIKACELAVAQGEGWTYIGWDAEAGDDYGTEDQPVYGDDGEPMADPETGEAVTRQRVIRTGDIDARVYHPLDVIRDTSIDSLDEVQWIVAHRREHRWDLAARFPEHATDIENAATRADCLGSLWLHHDHDEGDDTVSVFEFWHDKTPSMPEGRYSLVCAGEVLFDSPLPFDALPFVPLSPSQEIKRPFGYSRHFDLMALQDALDACIGVMLTNHDAHGVQSIWTPKGSGLKVHDLGDGMKHWESTEPPQPMNLTATSEHSYKLADLLTQKMEAISGVNSVARGNPEASLKSGAALALVHSMAVQYNSGLQRAYARAFERIGSMVLARLRDFAHVPRTAQIAGKRGTTALRQFRGEDLGEVRAIKVDMGSAIMRTAAGRKEIADKFLAAGAIEDPQQYLEVMSTGRLDPLFDGPRAERLLIVKENEELAQGSMVRAAVTDNHQRHVGEHRSLMADPAIRRDGDHMAMILAHIQDHLNQWTTADPLILAATGQAPAPVPMGAQPPPGDGGPPMDAQPVPTAGDPNTPPVPAEVPAVTDMPNPPLGAQQAQLPNMPELPAGADSSLLPATNGG